MMFGMGHEGTTNLITKALQAVGKELETLPDPTQIHYHLPKSAAHPEVLQLWRISLLTGCAGCPFGLVPQLWTQHHSIDCAEICH